MKRVFDILEGLAACFLGGIVAAVGAFIALALVLMAFWPVFVSVAAIVYLWRTFA